MSKRKHILKLKRGLKSMKKYCQRICLTITNSANENESITLSFIDGVVQMKKIIKSEQTTSEEVSEITFN